MATDRKVSIWEKVDPTLVRSPTPAPAKLAGTGDAAEWRRFWRRRRPVLDGVASLFWLYAVLKVFFVDLDEALLSDLSDYRVFFFLAIAAGLVSVQSVTRVVACGVEVMERGALGGRGDL
jgi:hypothetical protein